MTGVCPVCDTPLLVRCPQCGYHPQMVYAELMGVARRLAGQLSGEVPFGATLIRLNAGPRGRCLGLTEIYALPGGQIASRALSCAELTPEEHAAQQHLFILAAACSLSPTEVSA